MIETLKTFGTILLGLVCLPLIPIVLAATILYLIGLFAIMVALRIFQEFMPRG